MFEIDIPTRITFTVSKCSHLFVFLAFREYKQVRRYSYRPEEPITNINKYNTITDKCESWGDLHAEDPMLERIESFSQTWIYLAMWALQKRTFGLITKIFFNMIGKWNNVPSDARADCKRPKKKYARTLRRSSGPRETNLKGTLLYATIAVVDAEVIDLRATAQLIEPFRDVNRYYGFSLFPLSLPCMMHKVARRTGSFWAMILPHRYKVDNLISTWICHLGNGW